MKNSGFDLKGNTEVLENSFKMYYKKARDEVLKVLKSPGYEHIIQGVEISEDFQEIKIQFKSDVEAKDQNVFQLFAFGGQIKKGDNFINIMPNPTLRKYIGKSR